MPDNAGGVIYGIIVVATLLAAESAQSETYAETIGGIAVALLTYWLMIAYAHYAGERLERDEPFRYGAFARAAVRELTVLYGAAIPLIVLAICWIVGASLLTAINVAIVSEALAVVATEIVIGVRADLRRGDLVRQTFVGATLGVLVIVLRLLLH